MIRKTMSAVIGVRILEQLKLALSASLMTTFAFIGVRILEQLKLALSAHWASNYIH